MLMNRTFLREKIQGCWVGKNIGGTMGAPYERDRNMQDISGYATKPGAPLPNDDLDLQLVWLKAVEEAGPKGLTPALLGTYWLTQIVPHWNEYGIIKSNLAAGLLPPLCGELHNDRWKHSNGAWIRSEIWACLCPGQPEIAVRYAEMDGCVDHGAGEGTDGILFTAALESLAFCETDMRTLLTKALRFLPEESRVGQAVRLVMQEYEKGTPYPQVRQMLVEQSEDLGWFQAPANIGFTVIGLLYGEGDFKKSMIYAINCGDDTDCSGATCGAVLGILHGIDAIPEDWKAYIGDTIVTACINNSYMHAIPATCEELTGRVMELIPSVLKANGIYMEYSDDPELPAPLPYEKDIFPAKKEDADSFTLTFDPYFNVTVHLPEGPYIRSGEEKKVILSFENGFYQAFRGSVQVFLPDGWQAEFNHSLFFQERNSAPENRTTCTLTLVPGDQMTSEEDLIVSLKTPVSPVPYMIPLSFFRA